MDVDLKYGSALETSNQKHSNHDHLVICEEVSCISGLSTFHETINLYLETSFVKDNPEERDFKCKLPLSLAIPLMLNKGKAGAKTDWYQCH